MGILTIYLINCSVEHFSQLAVTKSLFHKTSEIHIILKKFTQYAIFLSLSILVLLQLFVYNHLKVLGASSIFIFKEDNFYVILKRNGSWHVIASKRDADGDFLFGTHELVDPSKQK